MANIRQAMYQCMEQEVDCTNKPNCIKLFSVDCTNPYTIDVYLNFKTGDNFTDKFDYLHMSFSSANCDDVPFYNIEAISISNLNYAGYPVEYSINSDKTMTYYFKCYDNNSNGLGPSQKMYFENFSIKKDLKYGTFTDLLSSAENDITATTLINIITPTGVSGNGSMYKLTGDTAYTNRLLAIETGNEKSSIGSEAIPFKETYSEKIAATNIITSDINSATDKWYITSNGKSKLSSVNSNTDEWYITDNADASFSSVTCKLLSNTNSNWSVNDNGESNFKKITCADIQIYSDDKSSDMNIVSKSNINIDTTTLSGKISIGHEPTPGSKTYYEGRDTGNGNLALPGSDVFLLGDIYGTRQRQTSVNKIPMYGTVYDYKYENDIYSWSISNVGVAYFNNIEITDSISIDNVSITKTGSNTIIHSYTPNPNYNTIMCVISKQPNWVITKINKSKTIGNNNLWSIELTITKIYTSSSDTGSTLELEVWHF